MITALIIYHVYCLIFGFFLMWYITNGEFSLKWYIISVIVSPLITIELLMTIIYYLGRSVMSLRKPK